jgi:hypothetical protein
LPGEDLGDGRSIDEALPFYDMQPDSSPKVPLWGNHFTWAQRDSHDNQHSMNWNWKKTLKRIGPGSYDDSDSGRKAQLRMLVDKLSENFYPANLASGFRVEGAGLGYIFPRMLAAYYGLMDPPTLEQDLEYHLLPIDGPTAHGTFLGNTNTMELHYLPHEQTNCQINEIKPGHRKWFKDISDAEAEGFDTCYYCFFKEHD